jgi:branched-chain amino acid transport system permease protein
VDALANNLQVLFQGLALGSIYALVALGFVLIIRATNVVNFAQGDFAMLGAYMMVAFLVGVGLPYWLSFLLALIGMGVFGLIFNYGVYYPLRHRGFLPVIISTLGASIFLQNTVLALFGAQPKRLDNVVAGGVQIGSVFLDSQYLVILAVTMVMVAFQYFLFEHTLIGKKLQATSQDKDMARLLGIPVALMIAITFVYSSALGGLAGVLVGPVLFVSIGMGSIIALKAFAATIIGGFGDVKGAIVGGLFIGVVESFAAFYISVPY